MLGLSSRWLWTPLVVVILLISAIASTSIRMTDGWRRVGSLRRQIGRRWVSPNRS